MRYLPASVKITGSHAHLWFFFFYYKPGLLQYRSLLVIDLYRLTVRARWKDANATTLPVELENRTEEHNFITELKNIIYYDLQDDMTHVNVTPGISLSESVAYLAQSLICVLCTTTINTLPTMC